MYTYSCFDGTYRAWGKIIAAKGIAVVMVDFRNAATPSSVSEVAPFPAGLNDCISGLRWTHANSAALCIDRIVVAGESGGGNLALATAIRLRRESEQHLIAGVYALCPFIGGRYPDPAFPSTLEESSLLGYQHARFGYSAIAYGADHSDPLAWPAHAAPHDVAGLPPVVIRVNECDPLRDEGAALHATLAAAGVDARLRVVAGASHAAELMLAACPRYGREAVADMAAFCRELSAA